MKQKYLFLPGILLGILTLLTAGGCRQAKSQKEDNGKINVTSLIFPSYDFVRAIAGDKVNLVMLLPPGAESHSYEPSPRDILTIRESDLFIYSGGANSVWADRIIESLSSNGGGMKVLALMDLVETVEEELVEGMEDEPEEHHDPADEAPEYDEHVWTSPRNAKTIVASITEALCDLDGANGDFYRQNAADYSARLDELDSVFKTVVEGAKRKTVIFGDRFPFRYFTDAYGLSYFAAFPGCSAETEPSAGTIAFLINKVKDESFPIVFHTELSNEKMADTICEASGAKKLLLHSCHNITRNDFENGITYLDLQEINAAHLREALW